MCHHHRASRCRGWLLLCAVLCAPALADPIVLAPTLAGRFRDGAGVDAQFLKVQDSWRGSGVLYDAVTDQLGVGQPIGNFPGGSGLWGLVDWRTAYHQPAAGMIEARSTGRAAQIAFSDDLFNRVHGDEWGEIPLAPLFEPEDAAGSQDNWTAHFHGYIRIAEAGLYNFGVLHDDGFFFDLHGAAGQRASLSNDFLNPPNRMAFAGGLQLDAGLYAFELGSYERLEAGVVELSWMRGGGTWSRVPSFDLVAIGDVVEVPEPGSGLLLAGGLLALAATRRSPRPRGP
jgi:hypothetical protein